MDRDIESVFDYFFTFPNGEDLDFSYESEDDLNNIEAMSRFIEENNLSDYIIEDYGTLVILKYEGYDSFLVAITSEGLGDFFNHGIFMNRLGDKKSDFETFG